MKPILIVKLGSAMPALVETHGDFEDWIEARLGLEPGQVAVAAPHAAPLPDPRLFCGVVLTGSHSMVTDCEAWSERTAVWIRDVIAARTPLLGICYGHQLIAQALGGEVGPNPRGRELGTVEVELREAAQADPLFAGLPGKFLAYASHEQSVLRLPPGATCLGANAHEPHHAYAVGPSTWGVQFHPEFDELAMKAYVGESADELHAAGMDPARLRDATLPTPHAEALLRRFALLVWRANLS